MMICYLLLSIAGVLQGRADPEIHLIPAGYAGPVTIAFRAQNGEAVTNEGAARLYRIPPNGILVTQAEPNVGPGPEWIFFHVTPDGERVRIQRVWGGGVPDTPENRAYPDVEVFALTGGRLQRGRLACDVQLQQYFVGTRLQWLTRNRQTEMRQLSEFLAKNFTCQ